MVNSLSLALKCWALLSAAYAIWDFQLGLVVKTTVEATAPKSTGFDGQMPLFASHCRRVLCDTFSLPRPVTWA